MRIHPVATLLVALPLAAALACGGEKTVETDEGTLRIDRDDQTVTLEAEGEKFEMKTGEGVELPDDFPKDVPVYPSATILTSMTSAEGIMVSTQSTADPTQVVSFYKEKMEGEGWTVEAEMNMGPQRIISFTKDDRKLMVTAGSQGDKTLISLVAGG